jgi:hypothetical protein
VELIDSTYRTLVLGSSPYMHCNVFNYISGRTRISSYDIVKYEAFDRNVNVYDSKLGLIVVSDSITLCSHSHDKVPIACLPPFPKKSYANDVVNHIGSQQKSDILVDSNLNVFYVFYDPLMKGSDSLLYLYLFDQHTKQWTSYTLETNTSDIRRLRIFTWHNNLYVGIWYYPDRFQVVKCNLG